MRFKAAASLAVACALGIGLTQMGAQAQDAASYPAKPIRIVVPFPAGGTADLLPRIVGERLTAKFGQPVLVENRAGAGSSIAAEYVAKSAPDGYTILIASPSSIAVNPAINPKLGYKPSDLSPVTKVSSSPLVVAVNTSIGINSIRELIARAKKDPGKLNYASSGVGSAPHLAALQFTRVAGLEMVHVPFKGGGPAVQAVVAGDVDLTFGTPPSVLPLMKAGRLKGLAVTTRNRFSLVPELPGMEEAGLSGYDISFWYGVFVPAGTPADVVKKLYDASLVAVQKPEVKQVLAREGTETAQSRSPEDFANFVAEDSKIWARLAKESGAKME